MFQMPEEFRIKRGPFATTLEDGNNGAFLVPHKKKNKDGFIRCIASDGDGWEHVSVSLFERCPTWEEMCYVKNLFWDEDDLVVQFHPPRSDYVNLAKFCLHLWRRTGTNEFCERPHKDLVGGSVIVECVE